MSPCPHCHSKNVFKSKEVSAGGRHAPDFLPGLGKFFATEEFQIVLCKDCGLARFFARSQATAKLEESSSWTRV